MENQWAKTGEIIGYLCDQPVYCKWDDRADSHLGYETGGHVASVTINDQVYIGQGHEPEDAFDAVKAEVNRMSAC